MNTVKSIFGTFRNSKTREYIFVAEIWGQFRLGVKVPKLSFQSSSFMDGQDRGLDRDLRRSFPGIENALK
jgi:hypothetical protein